MMFQPFVFLVTSLIFVYLFYCWHWKFLVLFTTCFGYYSWRDWDGAVPPTLCYHDSSPLCQKIVSSCAMLREKYTPTVLWGKSGHVQTLLYGMCGRFGHLKDSSPRRHSVSAADGSTIFYDLFAPEDGTQADTLPIVFVCPGIGSHSSARYIQSLVQHMTRGGHRVVVMNHVGALPYRITGKRVFSYGGAGDLALVCDQVMQRYPLCKLVGVGYSLGANILMRFLAECPDRQGDFLCAISLCQGYDPVRALPLSKTGWRCFYNLGITKGMQQIIRTHQCHLLPLDTSRPAHGPTSSLQNLLNLLNLFSGLALVISGHSEIPNDVPMATDRSIEELTSARDSNGFPFDHSSCEPVDMAGLSRASILQQLDECYTRRVMGFRSIHELYCWSGCARLLHKIPTLPILLVNAKDDPLVMESLWSIPIAYTRHNPNAIFLSTQHGGHLGFFEGGLLRPNTLTWIDRLVHDYTSAVMECSK